MSGGADRAVAIEQNFIYGECSSGSGMPFLIAFSVLLPLIDPLECFLGWPAMRRHKSVAHPRFARFARISPYLADPPSPLSRWN